MMDTGSPFSWDLTDDALTSDFGIESAAVSKLPTSQVPTPPGSHAGSPHRGPSGSPSPPVNISVSTMFYPGAEHFQAPPDFALSSTDFVYFYVHGHRLRHLSSNDFGHLLSSPSRRHTPDNIPAVSVNLSSPILNLILHAIYDFTCHQYAPDFETLAETIDRLADFGLRPEHLVLPNSPLFHVLLSYAPVRPIDVFALAGKHNLNELAVATSGHMLSFPLATINDEIATRIGPVYLKKLFFLHLGRMEALRRILLQPPHPHAPAPDCDFVDQKRLTRAWSLASAYLAFDARPDMSTSSIESVLRPLAEHLTCEHCLASLDERIKTLVANWQVIKRTI